MAFRIAEIASEELILVHQLSYTIWPVCYANIISEKQIAYMLEKIYSLPALKRSMEEGQRFLVAFHESDPVGYSGFEKDQNQPHRFKLQKLYVLPHLHGLGMGKALFLRTQSVAIAGGCTSLFLQVNKKNPAVEFYRKLGMSIKEEAIVDIGNGFVMDDYIMQLDW